MGRTSSSLGTGGVRTPSRRPRRRTAPDRSDEGNAARQTRTATFCTNRSSLETSSFRAFRSWLQQHFQRSCVGFFRAVQGTSLRCFAPRCLPLPSTSGDTFLRGMCVTAAEEKEMVQEVGRTGGQVGKKAKDLHAHVPFLYTLLCRDGVQWLLGHP